MLNEKAVLAACDAYHADLPTHDYPSKWAMEQAITAYLSASAPEAPEDVAGVDGLRVQGMVRSIQQWQNFKPEAVAEGSDAQVFYFIRDAKHDMNALWRFAVQTLKRAEPAEAEAATLRARIAELEAKVEPPRKDLADWSSLPQDIYVVGVKSPDGIVFDVACCSVPMAIGPEVRYTRAARRYVEEGK